MTQEQFWALLKAPQTAKLVREARAAYNQGDKKTYDQKKKSLPLMIFIGTYDESEKEVENKNTGEKRIVKGCWRNQKHVCLNGLCVIDFDHVDETSPEGKSVREIWDEAYARLSEEDKKRIVFVFITPSGHGLKVVFMADAAVGNLIDNQKDFSLKLGLAPDEKCRDASRGAFQTTIDDIILLDEEKLFSYEDKAFGEKYDAQYRGASKSFPPKLGGTQGGLNERSDTLVQTTPPNGTPPDSGGEPFSYHGVPMTEIIEKLLGGQIPGEGDRHDKMRELSHLLRYVCDNTPKKVMAALKTQQWVLDLIAEGDPVEDTVIGACKLKYGKNKPEELLAALGASPGAPSNLPQKGEASGTVGHPLPLEGDGGRLEVDDIYASLPLDQWAEELQEMAKHYPCMKELFLNVHPHKLPAVLFSSAALFGTLMTRAWYHFWYEPEIIRRLNYSIFIIGDPGAGKNVIEKFYKKIADPMIQADQCLIDAVNRYKEGRTERSTSTKAQKGEALKRPVVGIRVHPARTATGEFIRHMNAAIETVQGVPLNLHMFSFDAELDNVTKQNKGGDWKDREILELKAFHNEEDGQMYANQESVTGMFNVYWNFIYTGTPYALHRKVNQRNFGTGMSTRLAVIPLPDKGLAKRHQQVDPDANETLNTWAYRLDRVEGEIPIEPLNDETYDWQSSHMEIAEFNSDKADRTLLKRIPYYGIGISLPFILMRHWDEWQEHRTLTMDDTDRRLCRLAMEIQYKCQQFYFGEMAFNYFADQNKEFVQRRRSTRYNECFRKLPDEFKTSQFMECFGCSKSAASRSIIRFEKDKVIERVKYGIYKKILAELP